MRKLLATALAVALAQPTAAALAHHESGLDPLLVSQSGGLSDGTIAGIAAVANKMGGQFVAFHRGLLRLEAVTRGGVEVQRAPSGYTYPLSASAVDPARAWPLLAEEVLAVLRRGEAVVGEAAARLRTAQVGDSFFLLGWDGTPSIVRVGAIVPDQSIDWFEVMVSEQTALSLGLDHPTYAAIWGLPPGENAVIALASTLTEADVRIRPAGTFDLGADAVMPTVLVKEHFGEFAFRPSSGDLIEVDPAWREANIVDVEVDYLGLFRCHRAVVPYLRGAIAQIESAGLGGVIDRADFQLAGGCYNPRMIRGANAGVGISRHAWGIAVDINPTTNPVGSVTNLPEPFGEILRTWGFAWGSGWTFPDPMHFEWSRLPVAYAVECSNWSLKPIDPTAPGWTVYARDVACPED